MTSIQALKAVLRQEIRTKLNSLSKSEQDIQSDIIVKQFLQLPAYKNSKRISVYLSTENEISTEEIVRQIFEDNKECFVPRYSKKNMEMVKLSSMHDWETLPLTPWNIKQPSLKEVRENAMDTGGLDLIVVPGLAFTKNGKRMGQGGGYYDKFLELNQKREKPPTTIALAFKEQIVENMPTHEYDRNIDQVLFTNEILQ